jgi:hypothetical protein
MDVPNIRVSIVNLISSCRIIYRFGQQPGELELHGGALSPGGQQAPPTTCWADLNRAVDAGMRRHDGTNAGESVSAAVGMRCPVAHARRSTKLIPRRAQPPVAEGNRIKKRRWSGVISAISPRIP